MTGCLNQIHIFCIAVVFVIECLSFGFCDKIELITLNSENEIKRLNNLEKKEWWEAAAFYQIYPRSFEDSNGDGIGDLVGITNKMEYLKELGIDAFWLSPIFKSPMADFGYDISDYFEIQPEYGTLNDFDNLVVKAKQLGLKVILDFVPNHTSDEHDWFIASTAGDTKYKDFYIWHPGKPNPNGERNLPPNNWISIFRGSAWQWNEERQEYYFHQFHHKQPDLNYRNPIVVETMKTVLRYWLNRGVDGFRIDAVPSLFEVHSNENGNYPDEPRTGWNDDPNDWNYLKHIYTQDQPETLDMVYQWRAVMDDYQAKNGGDTRIIMTEAYSSIEIVMKYYGNGTVQGAHMPFNFQIIINLNNMSNAYDFKRTCDIWMANMPEGRTANWVMGNHDQQRIGTRMGEDRIDMMNMMLLTLPGASVSYNGEELGMLDVWISWKDTVDPQACNTNSSVYWKYSRDPERTPMQWDDSTSAGFSTNNKTWLPISPDFKNINVAKEEYAQRSHLKIYQQLMRLRKTDTIKDGDSKIKALNQNVFCIVRELKGAETYITLLNIWDEHEIVDISHLGNFEHALTYEIVSISSPHSQDEEVDPHSIKLEPKESVVLKYRNIQIPKDYYKYEIFDSNGNKIPHD